MTGDEKVKKNRDPIFMVCLAVFAIAVIGIVGVYINDHYIAEDDTTAAYGDKVTVEYTGSYYDYEGGEFAVVFDTSYSSVAKNDKILKSNTFTEKSKYSSLSFTIGKGEVLEMFGNAVVGLKAGESTKVMVPSGEGYVGPAYEVMKLSDGKVSVTESMSKDNFNRLYPDAKLGEAPAQVKIKSVYGWDATATTDKVNNQVTVIYNPEVGKTYDYIGNEDSKFGTVKFKVDSIQDGNVNFTYVIDGKKTGGEDGEIQMIMLDLGQVMYITNVDGDSFTYHCGAADGKNYTGENTNMPLYFKIKLVKIGA